MDSNTKNLILPIANALYEVMEVGENLDQINTLYLKENPHWNEEYKGFFVETLIDCVRWFRLLKSCSTSNTNPGVGNYFELVKLFLLIKGNWPAKELDYNREQSNQIMNNFNLSQKTRSIRESIPDWLDSLGFEELGDRWEPELSSLNELAKICLRPNLIKISTINLLKRLSSEGFEAVSLNEGIVLKKRGNIFRANSFREGLFEVQDISSQQVAPFLQVEPGMRVIDACAGTGGKSLHISTLMKNKGKLIALDTEEWKLNELKTRSARAGLSIIESKVINTTKVIKRLYDSADRLLLDVPCSGLGVLRRNPDAKWRLTIKKMAELKRVQVEILAKYTKMVKPGGKVVYSTCSILPSENQEQISTFLLGSSGAFELEEEKFISPAESGFDGFYMARMVRVK